MAVLKGFAVFDVAANFFQEPFFVPSMGIALRGFSDAANNPESPVHKHPEDYRLFQIGDYNQESGTLIPLDHPVLCANATEYVKGGVS